MEELIQHELIISKCSCFVFCSGHLGDDPRTVLYQQLKEADGRECVHTFLYMYYYYYYCYYYYAPAP